MDSDDTISKPIAVKQAAAQLSVSKSTIRRMTKVPIRSYRR